MLEELKLRQCALQIHGSICSALAEEFQRKSERNLNVAEKFLDELRLAYEPMIVSLRAIYEPEKSAEDLTELWKLEQQRQLEETQAMRPRGGDAVLPR